MDTTVYVVDDDPVLADVIQMYFNGLESFRAVSFLSAHEALPAIISRPPDVLILDFMMPGMNGDELIERARDAGVTCPVIVLTGLLTDEEAREKNYLIGNRLVAGKPVQLEVLRTLVHQAQGRCPSA